MVNVLDSYGIEYEVALQEQGVIGGEVVAGEPEGVDVVGVVVDRVVDKHQRQPGAVSPGEIVAQLGALVACHDDDAVEPERRELAEQTVDKPLAVDLHHALGVVGRQLAQPPAHSRCKDYCLHDSLLLSGLSLDALSLAPCG